MDCRHVGLIAHVHGVSDFPGMAGTICAGSLSAFKNGDVILRLFGCQPLRRLRAICEDNLNVGRVCDNMQAVRISPFVSTMVPVSQAIICFSILPWNFGLNENKGWLDNLIYAAPERMGAGEVMADGEHTAFMAVLTSLVVTLVRAGGQEIVHKQPGESSHHTQNK